MTTETQSEFEKAREVYLSRYRNTDSLLYRHSREACEWARTYTQKEYEQKIQDLEEDLEINKSITVAEMRGNEKLAAKLAIAVEALEKEATRWNTCDHEYEPNTTMDYFRCDKCGARPKTVEAMAKIQEVRG